MGAGAEGVGTDDAEGHEELEGEGSGLGVGSALDAAADADGAPLRADEMLPASESVAPALPLLIAPAEALLGGEGLAPPEPELADVGEGDPSVEGVGKEGAGLTDGSCVPTSDNAPVGDERALRMAEEVGEGEKGALLPTALGDAIGVGAPEGVATLDTAGEPEGVIQLDGIQLAVMLTDGDAVPDVDRLVAVSAEQLATEDAPALE